jgi:hypothetical protein
MATNPISNTVRAAAEKLIQTKYKNAGLYATDKARGENRSVLSAAQHAKSSEKNAMRPASAAEINRAQTNTIQKRSVQVKAAEKTSPNPANPLRMKENFLSSISRAGQAGTGPAGKTRDSRIMKATGVKPEALDNANTVKVNSNPVPNRTSPSLSQGGRLGGAHAGGHGISELEMAQGKTPSKLGGLGALGARIVRATEGEVPLP